MIAVEILLKFELKTMKIRVNVFGSSGTEFDGQVMCAHFGSIQQWLYLIQKVKSYASKNESSVPYRHLPMTWVHCKCKYC